MAQRALAKKCRALFRLRSGDVYLPVVKLFPAGAVILLFLGAALGVGCQRQPAELPATIPETAGQTAVSPPITPLPTKTPPPLPTIALTRTPIPTPTASPTPAPRRIGAEAAVPASLAAAAQAWAAGLPNAVWEETQPDLSLQINQGEPVAAWVYAVAAPFATIPDEISLAALQAAWNAGELTLDAETSAVFTALWGEPAQANTIVPAAGLVDSLWAAQEDFYNPALTILPFDQLSPKLKVLRVDGAAPIDANFDPAAYPLTVSIGLAGEEAATLAAAWSGPATNRDEAKITTVAMTGPAGMRRAVADRMEKYGLTYVAEESGPVLQAADIAHMSNEDPFAPDCPLPDPNNSDNVCNRAEYFELVKWMGIDVMEVTGNHLADWGLDALNFTLDLYEEGGLMIFGGGRDLAAAQRPLTLEHNGNRIAFVGCNPVGPAYVWAKPDRPGTLPCGDYSDFLAQIRQLKEDGYLVIATLQYLEDYRYGVGSQQRYDFQALAEAGATVVSGSQGHHPQGFSFAYDSFIHYGVGNLLADQMWSLPTRQSFIDTYLFYDGRLLNVDLWTGLNVDYGRLRQMTPEERQDLLQSVFEASDLVD